MSEPSCEKAAPARSGGAEKPAEGDPARPEGAVSVRFGTDGIRGIAGRELTARTAFALGCALCRLYPSPRVVVGQDTRTSSDMLAHALSAGVAAGGGQAIMGGVLPSAAVSFFVLKERAACGVVVSASHNPPAYNGLKVFGGDGAKLPEGDERRLEQAMLSPACAPPLSMGGVRLLREKGAYLARLASLAPCSFAGKTFVIDCANGAARSFAPRLFRRLGARVFSVGCGAGKGINCACGALHPQRLCAEVRRREADAGFAYDGDADRLIACDERGEIVDGDGILYALACAAKEEGKLPRGLVVGTAYTNAGAERALAARGIRLLRAPVGDKFVAARMRESGASLGGEQSGHILLACSPAGDGILASLFLAALAARSKLSALCALPRLAQVHIGVRLPPAVHTERKGRTEGRVRRLLPSQIMIGKKGKARRKSLPKQKRQRRLQTSRQRRRRPLRTSRQRRGRGWWCALRAPSPWCACLPRRRARQPPALRRRKRRGRYCSACNERRGG